jgi:hypothetical protein
MKPRLVRRQDTMETFCAEDFVASDASAPPAWWRARTPGPEADHMRMLVLAIS